MKIQVIGKEKHENETIMNPNLIQKMAKTSLPRDREKNIFSSQYNKYMLCLFILLKQGKSEGFDSCDRPSNLIKNWIQIVEFWPV